MSFADELSDPIKPQEITGEKISLDRAKNLIVSALSDFVPVLGDRAAAIFHDDLRLNMIEVDEPQTSMMACRLSGVTIDDLQKAAMVIPDFAKKYGPHFTTQENPAPYAIIDYEYDGTTNSLSYLAHELGHAIADDIQRENGYTFRDFPESALEQQAYFVQIAVSDALGLTNINGLNNENDPLQTSFNRSTYIKSAQSLYETAQKLSGDSRATLALDILGQNGTFNHEQNNDANKDPDFSGNTNTLDSDDNIPEQS